MLLSFRLKDRVCVKILKQNLPGILTEGKSKCIYSPMSYIYTLLKIYMLTCVDTFLKIKISHSFDKHFSPQSSVPNVYMSVKQNVRPA